MTLDIIIAKGPNRLSLQKDITYYHCKRHGLSLQIQLIPTVTVPYQLPLQKGNAKLPVQVITYTVIANTLQQN